MVKIENFKILFLISFVVFALIYVLDVYIENTEKKLYSKLESSVIEDMSEIASNIQKTIYKNIKEEEKLYEYLKNQSSVRKELESKLNFLITKKLQYIYLIHKDENDKFHYLLDGSINDTANFNEKIDVEDKEYYEVYKHRQQTSIKQDNLTSLSITFLYPFIIKENVEAILVFDFTSAFEHELHNIISPLKTMFILIYIMIALFLIVVIIQTIFYYRARKRSYIDGLTEIYNRQYLRDFLETHSMADYQILMLDFDYFKKINDNYGHEIGDGVLVHYTKIIKSLLTKKDQFIRYGGEEFLVLLHNQTKAKEIAETIREKVFENPFSQGNIAINMSLSIGINPSPNKNRSASNAIKIADSMLYKAKIQGRNRVVEFSSNYSINAEDIDVNKDNIHNVTEALHDNKIICHFQKIIDSDNNVYKYETLVRYINKDEELVFPNHFLYDIMQTKIYTDLTKRVIDICINKIETEKVALSINLNANDLLNDTLVEYLLSAINTNDVKGLMTIELLENEEIKNMDQIKSVIKKLHDFNIKISIDDFGSGYANFNYLVELDVDYLKIDGYLVQSALHSEKSKQIVKSIIQLAHQMNIKTIAEFVSTKEIFEVVKELGSDYFQGFYIAKPNEGIK